MAHKTHINATDEELFELARLDVHSAFEEIYKRYWKLLFGQAYKRLKNSMQCEEIVQDIFTILWNKKNEIELHTNLKNYLLRSVTYHTIDYYRKEAVKAKYKLSLVAAPSFTNEPEETILANDFSQRIASIVHKLPEKCQLVYKMSREDHKNNKEIATTLSISEKTVENHLTKALRRIRIHIGLVLLVLLSALLSKF